jgi:major membrane immunogen (membrane-anchored lipoprotein)
MKYPFIAILLLFSILATACSTTIPLQTNLSDQTLLNAENKNIKADFVLNSEIPDGKIQQVYYKKNGKQSGSNEFDYKSETAFKQMWSSYFDNKFNDFSDDEMKITATLKDLYLEQQSSSSVGAQLFTGNNKSNVEAVGVVNVEVVYEGETYQDEFKVSSSEYQETQSTEYGTFSKENPMEQRSTLLQNTLNRSIIQFDNFIRQVLAANK